MGCFPLRPRIIGRILHRSDVLDFDVIRNDNNPAGMLTGTALNAGTPRRQAVQFRSAPTLVMFLFVFLSESERRFLCNRTNGTRAENILLPE
ncbi:hypothetical protein D3C74_298060 [compost metagenome]